MIDVRWKSPFPHTLAFNLFKEHITELNEVYWSFVLTSNTIITTQKALQTDDADPLKFFLVHNEDDKRIAKTHKAWKTNFLEFENYTRLNMVMSISCCYNRFATLPLDFRFIDGTA